MGDPYDEDQSGIAGVGCGDVGADEACLILRFQVKDSVRDKAPMQGDLHWGLYEGGDVGLFGPGDHEALSGGDVEGVDLEDPGAHVDVVIPNLEPGSYQALAFLDADGNGDADRGEAVTFPRESFDVPAGEATVVYVVFDMVHP